MHKKNTVYIKKNTVYIIDRPGVARAILYEGSQPGQKGSLDILLFNRPPSFDFCRLNFFLNFFCF